MDAPLRRVVVQRTTDPRRCIVDGCTRVHAAAGYCNAHYQRAKRGNDMLRQFRVGGTAWTDEDDRILSWHIGMEPIAAIANRLGRGTEAIKRRANERGLNFNREAERQAGYNLKQVSQMLGSHPESVRAWVERGWLRADRPWSAHHQRYSVAEDAIIEFIRERGGLIPSIRPPDRVWQSIVDQARSDLTSRYIRRDDLARVLGYDIRNISDLVHRRGMPAQSISLGAKGGGQWFSRAEIRDWINEHPQYWTRAAREALDS